MNKLTDGVAVPSNETSTSRPKSTLPTLVELAVPPAITIALICLRLLIEKHWLQAGGVFGGCIVAFVMYWALHYFAEHIFGSLVTTFNGMRAPVPGNMLLFGVLAGGKFVLIAVLMYVMIAVLHFNLIAFVVGFLITQAIVSISVLNRLSKTKATD